jgi:hypothetical protein
VNVAPIVKSKAGAGSYLYVEDGSSCNLEALHKQLGKRLGTVTGCNSVPLNGM